MFARAAILTLGLAGGAAASGAQAADATAVNAEAEALLSRMSLEEKIGQLNLVSNNPQFDRAEVEAGRVGGVLAFTSARDIATVQAVARRSRLGVPLLVGLDVVHGLRTMFPVPLAEAASFDPDLARASATVAAREATRIGVNWTFAPMADLARDARWGRIVEGFGEDPLLGRAFTAARVEGFHAGGLAVTLKHFVGYGAAVGGRDYDAAELSGADLADNYLPSFRAGIAAGAESVMSGFHTLNDVPATASRPLLTDLLRGRLGFDGFVVSDWLAVEQLIAHGVAADPAEAARKALLAGVDLDMASGLYAKHLAAEVVAGRVPEAAVTEAARRVLRTKLRLGLSERPDPDPSVADTPAPSAESRALARKAAQDTIVLLRNDGTLPLAAPQRVAVIGGLAESGRNLIGPHGALVRWEDATPVEEAIRRRAEAAGAAVAFAQGCDPGCGASDGFDDAVAAARGADVVVAVLGEPLDITGEAASRAHLGLPGRQAELLARLVDTGKPVILVLLASRPVTLGPIIDRLAGLMMAWFPGTEGGNALADLLFGDVSPSAKLPISWPRTVGQLPLTYDRLPTGRPADPKNRFTLRYVDEELTPLFPFGFGLTYSRFAFSDLAVTKTVLRPDETLQVSVQVANTGKRGAREIVQLYVHQPVAAASRPVRQLKAFAKVALGPGETTRVTLQVPVRDLGYTHPDGTNSVDPGPQVIFVGDASDDTPLGSTVEVAAE